MLEAVSDLEEVRQAGQHVGGDGRDVVDALTVFQKDPDQQQNRPGERETCKDDGHNTSRGPRELSGRRQTGHVPDHGVLLPVDEQEVGGLPVLLTCTRKHNMSSHTHGFNRS